MMMITNLSKLISTSPVVLQRFSLVLIVLLNNILKLRCLIFAVAEAAPVRVGVVLDMESSEAKTQLSYINMALSDFYAAHPESQTRIDLHVRESRKHNVINAAAASLSLLKYPEVKAIIMGPTALVATEFIIKLGEETQVPIISYSTTIPTLKSSYLIHAAQKDSLQAGPIISLMQAFQWRDVIPIYEESDYGSGLISFLDDALQRIGARISSHDMAVSVSATNDQISELLGKLKAEQTRVFLVHTSPELASRLFLQVNELNMMNEGYAWIVTTSISNEFDSLNQSVIQAMHGVIGLKTYVQQTNELKQFENRWELALKDVKLNVVGFWAYDAAFALARAVEEVAASNFTMKRTKKAGNVTDLDTLGVSNVGPELLKALHNTSFRGLAGNFSLTDGQLIVSSTFKVVNVLDIGTRDVGFWTPENGLTRKLNMRGSNYPPSSADLGPVIWPGETALAPKGWGIPADGRRLRVGVPVKRVYEQLVNLTHQKSGLKVTGFCIDIFEVVMKKLGYSFEYHPFHGPYDDMISEVFLRNYDIAVGDITIMSNRTLYVDFTVPYTESGVTMVVPIKDDDRQSAWVFLKPLSRELWLSILSTFIFIALVIWVIEHRINEDFRGPPLHQVGTSLFYSFSMMVFAQREKVFSNLTRLVVIVWAFVVLILTQTYTASLSSLLTVRQLQPASVDDLIRNGAQVSVQRGSFVNTLLKQLGFLERNIHPYDTTVELEYLLSNGRVAAVFDEIPYMKLFLATYPSKYIMEQPIYRTEGFGFVLPKGSPLGPEISQEIISMQGYKMLTIEKRWGMLHNSSDDSNNASSSSLISIESVWVLFFIVAIVSVSSLIIFFTEFLYRHRDTWISSDGSTLSRIRRLGEAFLQRDMAALAFRNREIMRSPRNLDTGHASVDDEDAAVYKSQETRTSLSLPDYTDQTDECLMIPVRMTPSPKLQDDRHTAHTYVPLETEVAPSSLNRKKFRAYWSM